MPNIFAYIALYSWPIVVFFLFRVMPRPAALMWSILGGYLLLPVGVGNDFPMLPTLDKNLIPALSAAFMCVVVVAAPKRRRRGQTIAEPAVEKPRNGRRGRGSQIEKALLLLLVVTPVLTVLQNSAPYSVGPRWLPGLQLYDVFSMILSALVGILPYLLARRYLSSPDDHLLLLRGLCVAGLFYSLPALFEVRMSPYLSKWIYGFQAQPWSQIVRDGGFRPLVFLPHGLWLAIFFAMTILAAFTLWRHEQRGGRWLLAGFWLLGTLALCHSLGGFAIALVLLPVVLLLSSRMQMIVAVCFAFIILFYPTLRGAGLIPVDSITAIAGSISPARAQSLEFRLKNEDILLAHANAKPLAGWGGWGRSRVYSEQSGADSSITDGMWIITVGVSGWLGYIAQFGLLTVPIFLLAINRRRLDISIATSGLCLALTANLIDMIPNATLTPITWLIAGALMGRVTTAVTDVATQQNTKPVRRTMRSRAPEAAMRGHRSVARSTRLI